ncbi:MAG TPA: hypothetical protein VJA64_02130 [Desulfobaccales bacterium]|nr:hypothetical protein [Desulfobaccales bacterium]
MEMGIVKILFIIYSSVGKLTYNEFIDEICDNGMKEVDNLPKTIFDSNLPQYDKSQYFSYKSEDFLIFLEALGINTDILQARVSIHIKRPILSFLSRTQNYYDLLVDLLTEAYGDGYSLNHPAVKNMLNFQNDNQVAYIHVVRQNKLDIITINTGNRKYYG